MEDGGTGLALALLGREATTHSEMGRDGRLHHLGAFRWQRIGMVGMGKNKNKTLGSKKEN